ncbi:MAG: hypothetical protein IPL52_01645 [Flavobacteriales bacterium]|nr:hypothetical protein [Flavobacteriales bacterium]
MARIPLALLLWPLGLVSAQMTEPGLGFDFSLTPSYVYFQPAGPDNWLGDKPPYATMALGCVNWNFPKEETSFGLGGGAIVWGERFLYPAYVQIRMSFSGFYRDSTKVGSFARRLSVESRLGTILGNIETSDGKLKPKVWYDALFVYQLSRSARSSFHIGIEMGIFSWRGPYQVRTGDSWDDSEPSIHTVGPVVQFRF